MARHDREESLEEQLAWLDAIKETEETPVSVSASTASADEPVASPYPQDPWLLVPQHDTPTPPLFRAAVDSVYGHAAAEQVPEEESEAGEWLDKATVQESAEEAPAPPVSLERADDPFLAPLKPLPRPDDTDSYSLSFTPPEQAESEKKSEPDDSGWASLSEWARPAESSGETQPMITELPKAFGESARTEPPRTEPPRTEPPRTEPPRTEPPRTEPPRTGPAPAEAAPAEATPAEAEAEERPVADEPAPQEERPRWDERPQWSDSSYREGLPQWPEPAQPVRNEPPVQAEAAPPREGAHRERQEWRPAEREIPPPPERRRRPAPIPVFTAPARPPASGRPTADSLDPESLLRGRRNAPSKGWRRLVYKASGGWIKPG
ncbi:MAG: hypothetical protein HOQ38_00640, partial [Nonomuraea sp.]|nr:hypothetical protein [Nonomuraea sp.]